MQLSRLARLLGAAALGTVLAATAPAALAGEPPEGVLDADFLFGYYDQDGDRSPVTGGVGTEKLHVYSPVLQLAWRLNESFSLSADVGVDQVSSASMGNIQSELSSASIPASDQRFFGTLRAKKKWKSGTWGLTVGAAKEYDYRSFSYGIDWGLELNKANTALSASVRRFDDAIDLIGIDGYGYQGPGLPITTGSGDRTTTDVTLGVSQTLGRRTVGSLELFLSSQDGVLSTPYHEVVLGPFEPGAVRVAERLPDSRLRKAVALRLSHSFSDRLVLRSGYRFYTDDWGISAHAVELEPHFRLRSEREMWLFPILRFSTQAGADWFGTPGTFTGTETYYTSDGDLAETTTQKYGVGFTLNTKPGQTWLGIFRRFEARAAVYDRDDGLTAFSTSFSFGWTY
ncbi:MAG TPA: DUF3570 domain-containing protein [Thermoanaerobaculia bacterium]|nr:DUF3570 domain-containing protein [Thermoanaerobaculia bacterium]HQN06584.1 DUF3570 domain-containing protein [Thermoanaerobaculia bacterium]HQP85752.1 DUF3570 domain-containing protein [Thermoanaerobaculia bacterium]